MLSWINNDSKHSRNTSYFAYLTLLQVLCREYLIQVVLTKPSEVWTIIISTLKKKLNRVIKQLVLGYKPSGEVELRFVPRLWGSGDTFLNIILC